MRKVQKNQRTCLPTSFPHEPSTFCPWCNCKGASSSSSPTFLSTPGATLADKPNKFTALGFSRSFSSVRRLSSCLRQLTSSCAGVPKHQLSNTVRTWMRRMGWNNVLGMVRKAMVDVEMLWDVGVSIQAFNTAGRVLPFQGYSKIVFQRNTLQGDRATILWLQDSSLEGYTVPPSQDTLCPPPRIHADYDQLRNRVRWPVGSWPTSRLPTAEPFSKELNAGESWPADDQLTSYLGKSAAHNQGPVDNLLEAVDLKPTRRLDQNRPACKQ